MAIEGHGGFEAKAVACAEAGGFEDIAEGVKVFHDGVHGDSGDHVVGSEDDFDAVLAGVSGAGDHDLEAEDVDGFESEAFELWDIVVVLADEVHHVWALYGEHGGFEGEVFELEDEVAADVGEVFDELVPVCGVADHEVVVVGVSVDEDVIAAAAAFVADDGIAGHAVLHAPDLPGAGVVEEFAGVAPGEGEAAHV